MLRLVPRARPISSRLFQTTRFYSSHHDHHHSNDHNGTPAQNSTGWPRPSGRSPVRPYERDQVAIQLAKTTHQTPEEVIELEGWLFGKKVIYLNSEKPYYEQIPNDDVQFMFGERPPPPGHSRYMFDWEILSIAGLISTFIIMIVVWWGKPETDMWVWAAEELRERQILAQREQKRLEE